MPNTRWHCAVEAGVKAVAVNIATEITAQKQQQLVLKNLTCHTTKLQTCAMHSQPNGYAPAHIALTAAAWPPRQ